MKPYLLAVALLINGCASQPVKPIYVIPTEPEKSTLPCSDITWYYIDEKFGISLEDFRLLLKCEKSDKLYIKDLHKQNQYFRGLLQQ